MGKGSIGSLGLTDANYNIIYKIDKKKVLLCSIGNYIKYLVVNHNGKEYDKGYTYIK